MTIIIFIITTSCTASRRQARVGALSGRPHGQNTFSLHLFNPTLPCNHTAQVIFLERLWGDRVQVALDAVALTPWNEVKGSSSSSSIIIIHFVNFRHHHHALLLPQPPTPPLGHRLPLGLFFTRATRFRCGSVCKHASFPHCKIVTIFTYTQWPSTSPPKTPSPTWYMATPNMTLLSCITSTPSPSPP